MTNVTVKIGSRLTAIVGRNGSMKTTLLGMLSQPFSLIYSEFIVDIANENIFLGA